MNTRNNWKTFAGFALRVIVAHMLTYFVFGMIMSNLLDYREVFRREIIRDYMIPMDQHNIILGPFLQPIRGLIFAIGLWPLRDVLIERKRGWLILWGLLVTIGILSTPAAAPGSVEGMLYTKLPTWYHLMGLPEITLQTLVFSIWLVWWERQSTKGHEAVARKENPLAAEIVRAVTLACFAFIGYAVGGITLALRANALAAETGSGGVDIEAAGANLRMQFMFVIAFIINALAIFWLARRVQARQLKLWTIFPIFWFIDALVPWLYQTVVFGSSHIPTAIMLGFFPAAIISASLWMNHRQHLQRI
jgi:hypothetical protein